MADHPHTIDRRDDATGENLIEQIAGVTDCQNNDMADAEAITPQTHQWTPRPLRPAIRAPTIGCPKEKARPNLGGRPEPRMVVAALLGRCACLPASR